LPGFHCSWLPNKIEVARSGELAYSLGTYRNGYNDSQGKPVEDPGHYAMIWRKQSDGHWRVVLATFSSELPLAPK
jgi:ketosteroid isomerase-like protein